MRIILRKNRRGLSSVVGAVFMILVMIGALNLIVWAIQQQDKVATTVIEKTNSNLAKLNEKMEISAIRLESNNKFNLTIANTGGSTSNIKSIYIVNETASPKQQYRYDINYVVSGGSSVTGVGQGIALVADSKKFYSVKVVSESGISATAMFTPLSGVPLQMSLYAIPPTVTTGENVTLLYSVTNNSTNTKMHAAIAPKFSTSLSCTAGPDCSLTKLVAAPSTVTVGPGATVLVKEIYKAVAPANTKLTFNASFTGAAKGNYVIERVQVISIVTIKPFIAVSPDIYMILPGPNGDTSSSGQRSLWGAVVVNPTNAVMTVSRVVITSYTAEHAGTNEIVTRGCSVQAMTPGSGWSCPHDNQIQWVNLGSPVQIQPGKIASFLVKVTPGTVSGDNAEEPAAATTGTVFTDLGRFTKAGYTVGMTGDDDAGDGYSPSGAVYMTNTDNTATALNNANMFGHNMTMAPGYNHTFRAVVADLDTNVDTYVLAGSKFIVNVPGDFKNVTAQTGGSWSSVVIQKRADGITQIIATPSGNTGDTSGTGEAKILKFWAVSPSPPTDTTYIMELFHHGTSRFTDPDSPDPPDTSAGALAEIALQIEGTA